MSQQRDSAPQMLEQVQNINDATVNIMSPLAAA